MTLLSPAVLDERTARALTDRIRTAVDELWRLLLEAHEGRAWEAMGYGSWTDYIEAEFDITRRRSYQLLEHARLVRELESAGVNNCSHLPEGQTRALPPQARDDLVREVRRRLEEEPDEEPETVAAEVIATAADQLARDRAEFAEHAKANPKPYRPLTTCPTCGSLTIPDEEDE